ncbi:GNAT family N-acetyltransferase, partial [Streptomyces sp. DT225]
VERVVAVVDVLNERSAAVARRLGMEPAETFTTSLPGQEVRCFRLEL